jgi:tetratricopeptide (TPR) repeat protein
MRPIKSRLFVIPAKAGIQCSRRILPGPGFRRGDDERQIRAGSTASVARWLFSLKEAVMRRKINARAIVLAVLLGAITPYSAFADGGGGSSSSTPEKPLDPDYVKAEKAIEAKDWDTSITLLKQVVARDDTNADAYNYLGYAERHRGNLEIALQHYDRALALDPKHLGAREYLGEAYLMAENLPKAEEQLAALDKLCFFPCSEYTELKEKIAGYKQKH